MSGYPLVLDGEAIIALIVGGGAVAERKARALLDAGARVRVVAPHVSAGMRALAASARCSIAERAYAPGDLSGATLVVAAADRRDVNAQVATDARRAGVLVNVADDPAAGTFVTVATHRAGALIVGVTAGGVPGVAARIRDAIASRFDTRYADAVSALAALRQRLLSDGDRDAWRRAADALIGESFCARVEHGGFVEEVAAWR